MRRLFIYLFLFSFFRIPAGFAQSRWEGKWAFERYINDIGGYLHITDCHENVCRFEIGTSHGAHTCSLDGELKIDGNNAVFSETVEIGDEAPIETLVEFALDAKKRIITVEMEEGSHSYYCGMRGVFEGKYEHEDNPLRYESSFDCWSDGLSETEKVICATEDLAKADVELAKDNKDVMSGAWLKERENCGKDKACLWDFYVKAVRNGYEKRAGRPLNLYEYMGKLEDDAFYFPTDFVLLKDYFKRNMADGDYGPWIVSFCTVSMGENACKDCYFHSYGVAGLYTIYESAFYIDKDEIWLAFISANLDDEESKYIIVYAPEGKSEKDIPEKLGAWIERLKPHYPKGIKLKHFKEGIQF